jgi:hypothetical protein
LGAGVALTVPRAPNPAILLIAAIHPLNSRKRAAEAPIRAPPSRLEVEGPIESHDILHRHRTPCDATRAQDAAPIDETTRGPVQWYPSRCRCLVPQIEKPIGGEVVSEFEHLRVIAPELLTHAAGQTSAFLLQVVGHPRPLAQFHNHWLVIRQTAKGVPIGAQAVGQHVSVAPVILKRYTGFSPPVVGRCPERQFAIDSPLEERRFELSVPPVK